MNAGVLLWCGGLGTRHAVVKVDGFISDQRIKKKECKVDGFISDQRIKKKVFILVQAKHLQLHRAHPAVPSRPFQHASFEFQHASAEAQHAAFEG